MAAPPRKPTESAEDALAIVHQTLIGEAVDASAILAFVADERMRYVAVNGRACELLGYTRAELLQLTVSEIAIESSAASEFAQLVSAGSRAGVSILRAKDGGTFEFHYFASEARIAGLTFYLALGVVAE